MKSRREGEPGPSGGVRVPPYPRGDKRFGARVAHSGESVTSRRHSSTLVNNPRPFSAEAKRAAPSRSISFGREGREGKEDREGRENKEVREDREGSEDREGREEREGREGREEREDRERGREVGSGVEELESVGGGAGGSGRGVV